MNKTFHVVLDTNILLVSISSKSKYHKIFRSLLDGAYHLHLTNEILLEYEEIITQKYNQTVALNTIRTLMFLKNVHFVTPYFKWKFLKDQDDDKFIDCFVSSNSDFLVTNDKGFDIVKTIDFPKIKAIDIETFIQYI